MRRSYWQILVVVVAVIGTIMFLVPMVSCPSCSGGGKITVMGSHPEAMGSERPSTGQLVDVACPSCEGKSRLTLCQRLTRVPSILSRR
jgi:hypothetical protein